MKIVKNILAGLLLVFMLVGTNCAASRTINVEEEGEQKFIEKKYPNLANNNLYKQFIDELTEEVEVGNYDNIYKQDPYDRTLLHMAVYRDDFDSVQKLAGIKGIGINIKDSYGNTAIHIAAQYGFIACLNVLLTTIGFDLDIQNYHGDTPLFLACLYGRSIIVQRLLAFKCDVNKPNNSLEVPMHAALKSVSYSMIKSLLVAPKIDLLIKNKHGETLLDLLDTIPLNAIKHDIRVAVEKQKDKRLFRACLIS